MKKIRAESESVDSELITSHTSFVTDHKHSLEILNGFGVCTPRHINVIAEAKSVPNQERSVVTASLGPGLIKWDLNTHTRLKYQQFTRDLITCLLRNPVSPQWICLISHGGEVNLIDSAWKVHCSLKIAAGKTLHAHWSPDGKLITVTSHYHDGLVTILNADSPTLSIRTTLKLKDVEFAETIATKYVLLVYGKAKTSSRSVVELRDIHETAAVVSQCELEGPKDISAICSNSQGHVALATGRMIYLLSCQSGNLQILHKFEAKGSGIMKSLLLTEDDLIVCPSDNIKITAWKEGQLWKTLQGSSGTMYNMTWNFGDSQSGALITCTDNGFFTIDLNADHSSAKISSRESNTKKNESNTKTNESNTKTNESNTNNSSNINNNSTSNNSHPKDTLEYHKISCCGLDCCEDMIAVGDLAGNVMVWRAGDNEPIHTCAVESGVRAVLWKSKTLVLFGVLDGTVFAWDLQSTSPPTVVYNTKAAPSSSSPKRRNCHTICMEWAHPESHNPVTVLGTGNSAGDVTILWLDVENTNTREKRENQRRATKEDEDNVHTSNNDKMIVRQQQWQAHPEIVEEDDKTRPAEIWSLAWAPGNKLMATASEDHTTRIWDVTSQTLLQVLRGHTAAVTSVDWNFTSVLGLVLATCSDDKTVRLYNGQDLQLLHIFCTAHIPEWYTLTYLQLELDGDRVAISSQNGFVYIFQLSSKELLLADKLHQGSIEGLRWKNGNLGTCASDCCAFIARLITH